MLTSQTQQPASTNSKPYTKPSTIPISTTYLYTPTQYLISSILFILKIDFLTTKKTIQDDLIVTLKGITDLKNKPQQSTSQLREQLRSKKQQLQSIKRKLNKSCQQQAKVYDIMRKRIHRHQPDTTTMQQDYQSIETLTQFQKPQNSLTSNIAVEVHNLVHKVEQNQKDALFSRNKLFDLQLNKEIVYFMVDETVKKEEKLKHREKIKFQLEEKQKLKQENKQEVQKIIDQEKQQKPQNQQQQQHSDSQQILQNPQQVIQNPQQMIQNPQQQPIDLQQGGFQYTIAIQIPIQNQLPQINIYQDIFDLQRFFQQQDIEIESNQMIRNFQKFKQDQKRKKGKSQKIQEKQRQNMEELHYTRKELFNEERFTEQIQEEAREMHQGGEMEVEGRRQFSQDPNSIHQLHQNNSPTTKNNHSHLKKYSLHSYFQGQLQLQCTLYRKQHSISADILSNSLQSITQFLYENTHMIKKYQSNLEFWVILCRAIQLIKSKQEEKEMLAIQIIRQKLSKIRNCIEDWQKKQLQKVTGMLLKTPQLIDQRPYLVQTEKSFKQVFQKIYRLPDFNRFLHSLYTGALILKTPTCIQKQKQNPLICPLCNPLAQQVFSRIPILTRSQSTLICRINGSTMDHENYPIMLPSNQIYSLSGLEETKKVARNNSGKLVEQYYCKFTETWYNKDLAKKVFLA